MAEARRATGRVRLGQLPRREVEERGHDRQSRRERHRAARRVEDGRRWSCSATPHRACRARRHAAGTSRASGPPSAARASSAGSAAKPRPAAPASASSAAGSGRSERETSTNDSPSSGSAAKARSSWSRYQAVSGERSGSWSGRASRTTRTASRCRSRRGRLEAHQRLVLAPQPAAQLVPAQPQHDRERLEDDPARHLARAQLAVDEDDRHLADPGARARGEVGRLDLEDVAARVELVPRQCRQRLAAPRLEAAGQVVRPQTRTVRAKIEPPREMTLRIRPQLRTPPPLT